MTAFERMERAASGNVGRIAAAVDGFGGPSFVGYNSEERRLRIGKSHDDCWSYSSPVSSVVCLTEGKGGRIDALFERCRIVGGGFALRTSGDARWYQGDTACERALKDAACFLGIKPKLLLDILKEVEDDV